MKNELWYKIDDYINKYNFIYYPFFFVVGGGFLFFYFPIHFAPDIFKIKQYLKIYELISTIITCLVSLIGIYISVSLVAYEFFKQKSGIDFHKSFLVNRVNSYYISFSVLTIIFSFVCSILISSSDPSDREISVIYFISYLFIFDIAFLFPVAFNLFSSLRPEKLANDELHKITIETIFIKSADKGNIDKQTEYFENDSLLKIESIVIALVSVKDILKARAIIQKTTIKLSNLIINEENTNRKTYIVERLISFYIKIIDFSLNQANNSAILRSIWIAIDDMYTVLLERKETARHFEKFHKHFFERYFNRLLQTNNEELIYDGIKTLRRIIQKQVIFNMADDIKIHSFNSLRITIDENFTYPNDYSKEDFKHNRHWTEVAVELMSFFSYLINKGILLNRPDLINQCFEQINVLTFKLRLKNVGSYKQIYFLINSANNICDYAYRAFEKNVFIEGQDANYLIPTLFEDLIEQNHPAARTVLQKYCHLLIRLQQINKLDRWFLGGLKIGDFITTEGELGNIAKRCAVKFNDGSEIKNCLEDCIDTFSIFKDYYEINLPKNLGLYKVLKWQFNNIMEWLPNKNEDNQIIIAKLKKLIKSFKETD